MCRVANGKAIAKHSKESFAPQLCSNHFSALVTNTLQSMAVSQTAAETATVQTRLLTFENATS